MKRIKLDNVFEASHNSDTTEGRGGKVHIAYFTREYDAKQAVKGRGVMGYDGDVERVSVDLIVYESFEEFEQVEREKLRSSALKKLTYEERVALGLA